MDDRQHQGTAVSFRLSKEELADVDDLVEKVRRRTLGFPLTRAAVAKQAILVGLVTMRAELESTEKQARIFRLKTFSVLVCRE
jgi:hypothetical protein